MSRRFPPCRLRFALAVTVAAMFAGPPALRAADTTGLLPDGTALVLSLNVKQLLQAPLVRSDEKAFKQLMGEATKALERFGVDPAKDLDRVLLAASDPLKPASWLMLLSGRFDANKVEGRLKELARDRKADVQVADEGGAAVFQCRLPRPAVPNPTVTPPDRFSLTVLDGATVAVALERSTVSEAVAKKAGRRKAAVASRVIELVNRMDPRETLAVVFVPTGGPPATGAAAGLTTITGGMTVADGVKTDLRLEAKDAESAKRLSSV
ncbi:MAG TPA: hypothetical protein VGF55_34145, partial [Gemmataceae bacterium]